MDVPADQSSWLLGDRFEISGGPRSGGMGEVYRGVDLFDSTVVAVKFLSPSGQDESGATIRRRPNAGDLRRFSRECDMHLRLGGRGVPAHIAQELTGPRPYLVTEFVDGMDLYRFLRANRPSFTASVCVLFQLVQILTRVHACDVVHRDVKPLNILLSEKGEVFLVDFGIALPLTPGATRHTEGGRTPGSSGYKAPEIIQGERNPGPAADLYGAACTFFQLVTGRLVFESDGVGYTLERQHCEDTAPRLSDLVPEGVPPEVDDLVARMLDKNPSLRPTAHEVAEVLAPSLPRFGTLPPTPLLSPDPTLPFREGGAAAALTVPAAQTRTSARPSVRRQAPGQLTRSELRSTLDAAAEEVRRGEPGDHTRHLATLLDRARRKWGEDDLEALEAVLTCANGARIIGDIMTAGSRYRTVERLTATVSHGSQLFPTALAARLGAAECRLSEEGQGAAVLDAWVEVCRDLVTMGRTAPAELVERCVELGADLDERGDADPDTVTHWSGWLRTL
ncbi:serine/threonine-protein kinase [Streptomyces avidinii]|uniref:Serine/threonine protein kinase n=1 Tax=Streptomyces avidinii TaxID=1895 RepID=A0ABS4L005_STRAV|nr:serine/threonine-protein kinase [Streptomyces avidinii]MBP2035610.1 serine/threonine protein kinase [Streptomyces avidinii]